MEKAPDAPVQTFLEHRFTLFEMQNPEHNPDVLYHWYKQGVEVWWTIQNGLSNISEERFKKLRKIKIDEEGKTEQEIEEEYKKELERVRQTIQKESENDHIFIQTALNIHFKDRWKKIKKEYKIDENVCFLSFLEGARAGGEFFKKK